MNGNDKYGCYVHVEPECQVGHLELQGKFDFFRIRDSSCFACFLVFVLLVKIVTDRLSQVGFYVN